MDGWAHHVVWLGGVDGDVEFALGETRWDDAANASARSSRSPNSTPTGRMRSYMVARSPALALLAER